MALKECPYQFLNVAYDDDDDDDGGLNCLTMLFQICGLYSFIDDCNCLFSFDDNLHFYFPNVILLRRKKQIVRVQ